MGENKNKKFIIIKREIKPAFGTPLDITSSYIKKYFSSKHMPTRCMRFVLYQTTIYLFQKKKMFKGGARALSKQEKKTLKNKQIIK
jgi:hypothetical protein